MAATDERKTPQPLWEELDGIFRFQWDLAATEENAKTYGGCYFGPDHPEWPDALVLPWYEIISSCESDLRPRAWLNPPYSRDNGGVGRWLEKAKQEAELGLTTVALVRGDVAASWFHTFVLTTEHYFQRGRNAFEGAPLTKAGKLAPDFYGSVLAVYRPSLSAARWSR